MKRKKFQVENPNLTFRIHFPVRLMAHMASGPINQWRKTQDKQNQTKFFFAFASTTAIATILHHLNLGQKKKKFLSGSLITKDIIT